MSRPRFLADHDLNEHIVTGVLRREPLVEFIRVRDVGYDERPDSEVLDDAASERLIVVSHDVSTMLVRQRDPVGPAIEDLVLIWSASEAEEWEKQVRFLPL